MIDIAGFISLHRNWIENLIWFSTHKYLKNCKQFAAGNLEFNILCQSA